MKKTLATALLIGALSFSAAPAFAESYPAPSVTPNTANGVVPATVSPTPAPTTDTQELAYTGASSNLFIWAGFGALALLVGVVSVIRARRKV